MVDPILDPTPGNGGNVPTPEPKTADAFKVFASKKEHDDYLNQIVEDRLDRERKKYQDYDDLKAKAKKLKLLEEKDMTDIDKLKQEHADATGKVSSLQTELTGTKLENAKLKALVKAGVQPEQLDGLLKRVAGTTEDEIVADVEELMVLGWIGQKPAAPDPKPQGLGTPTAKGDPQKPKTISEQLAEVTARLSDPKTTYKERTALIDLSLQLNRRISKGEV
jgi:hypothetical protein